ncbi:MAG: hypothetical protein WAU68_07850 [Vitreimonas sp.]
MRAGMAAVLGIALAGCATTPVPSMRPLTQSYIDQMSATPVEVTENNNGVAKSWFYTSTASAGAAYGLIGALVSSVMDAIINAGPSARAQKSADEMARLATSDELNASLAQHLQAQIPAQAPSSGVFYESVESAQRQGERGHPDDVVQVNVRYTLSEDASTLRVQATATYQSPQTPYHTPYHFSGSPPRSEREGPAYSNTFTYYSSQLPVPTLTPELKERLVASIENSAREANGGELPVEGNPQFRAMNHELDNARDNNLTRDEIAIFLTREWLANDGARLHEEVERAHEFIARYVVVDMNRTEIPRIDGQDELLETTADERTVRRIGEGTAAGSYVSSASNVATFSSYGNTIAISHANAARIQSLSSASHRPAAAH